MAEESDTPISLVPQFITGDYNRRTVFLEDREYGLALDALVKVCYQTNMLRISSSHFSSKFNMQQTVCCVFQACSDILVVSSDGKSVLLGIYYLVQFTHRVVVVVVVGG
jgi:hypothetical protein